MEPVAPGTEDETIDFNLLTKKETENERVLKLKAILKNGQYENIFELNYINGAERWFCKVCECPIMGRVYQHELGRRHSLNLRMTNRHIEIDKPRGPQDSNDVMDIEVAPGEPVPPGMEGEVNRLAQIQERLDGFKVGPLVALEYLIEMHDYDPSKEPLYLCILCDKRGDPRTVLTHLTSYNHVSQYLQKHFPTCYRALAPYMTKQYKRNWQVVLQKVAEAIEKKFGRLKPFSIEMDKFEKDRMQYLTMISKGKHFSEQMGPTFVELVVHDELTKTYDEGKLLAASNWGGKPFIEKPFQKRSPSPPTVNPPSKKPRSTIEENKKINTSYEDTKNINFKSRKVVEKSHMRTRRDFSKLSSISSDDESGKEDKKAKSKSPPRDRGFRHRSPSPAKPWERDYKKPIKESEEQKQKLKEKERLEKLEKFKALCKAIENDMEKTLKNHEKNPEKHPKYNDEWKLFWNKRYKELQTEGKDATKYDFKPEWIQFWGKKMLEMHQVELKTRKNALRKRLGLPEEMPPISFRIGAPVNASKNLLKTAPSKDNKPNLPMAARPDNDPEIILIEDTDDVVEKTNKSATKSRQSRSPSPWERETVTSKSSTKDKKRSPSPGKRKSRERSRERRNVRPKDRSLERSRERSRRSRSRDLPSRDKLLRSPGKRISRDKRSRSPDHHRRAYSRERDIRDREYKDGRDRRGYSKERNWDKERERYRESSYERDLKARERIRTVADLPWEKEKMKYSRSGSDYKDYYGPPSMMRGKPLLQDDNDNGEVNIVSILRLLTALEERLGSLGPKIIDLLAQALALEKKEANSSESLLDNEINCVMFETVKEKLKGQLLAGLVDPIQERAFKKAIQKTASLIHLASERKKKNEPSKLGQAAVAVPGVGAVDKGAIAKQLANALIAQGKTDVTQEQLEQLINAVVGMAEASRASNKPVTTASFLAQLSDKTFPKVQKEKIIIPRVKSEQEKADIEKSIIDLDKLTEPLSPSTPEKSTTSNMENLSDSDLQTLLQNFKDLSTDEQMNLINYLKKLELDEPERVERLRKFVNLGSEKAGNDIVDLEKDDTHSRKNDRESPFSSRIEGLNPDADDSKVRKEHKILHLDSEDEDYSYEDVVKAASKNVKQKEMEDTRKIIENSIDFDSNKKEANLNDAKALISNLMSSFTSNSNVNMLGLASKPPIAKSTPIVTPTSSADFVKNLSNISIDNLTSIVNSVQMATQNASTKKLNFEPPERVSSPTEQRQNIGADFRLSNPLEPLGLVDPASFLNQAPRGPVVFNQIQKGSYSLNQGPRNPPQGVSHPPSGGMIGSIQGNFQNSNQGPRGHPGPRPDLTPQFSENFPAGNQNRGFQNQRQPRPLLNLRFGNPRFSGPNVRRGQGPNNNYGRW